MNKHRLVITLISVCVISAAVAFGVKHKVLPKSQNNENPKASVREKARQKGNYMALVRPLETTRYDDAEALAKDSTLVVTGLVRQQRSFIPETNERLIITAYELLVQEVFKGPVKTGDTLSIETLGGTVQFEDGTTAEMKVPEIMKNPKPGKSYLLFLRPIKSAFRLVGGPQGLFEIVGSGKLKPQVPPDDTLMQKYNDAKLDTLVKNINSVSKPGR